MALSRSRLPGGTWRCHWTFFRPRTFLVAALPPQGPFRQKEPTADSISRRRGECLCAAQPTMFGAGLRRHLRSARVSDPAEGLTVRSPACWAAPLSEDLPQVGPACRAGPWRCEWTVFCPRVGPGRCASPKVPSGRSDLLPNGQPPGRVPAGGAADHVRRGSPTPPKA